MATATAKVKKFLIQFECSEETRWLFDDDDLTRQIQYLGEAIAMGQTQGQIPRVVVVAEEQAEVATPCPIGR